MRSEESKQVKVKHASEVPAQDIEVAGAAGVKIQWLVAQEDAPENFYMRLFQLEPGGHTPLHGHPWEHEVFVLEGEGSVVTPAKESPLEPNSVVYVPAGEEHQFKNGGARPLKFICLVPKTATY
jgi:quercetin dioxygenase-like cupin family protein